MKKFLACCSFVIASMAVIAVFLTATTYVQLGAAIFIYTLLVFVAFKLFPREDSNTPVQKLVANTFQQAPKPVEKVAEAKTGNNVNTIGISDIDKRVFLKLIGGAGLALFLFSLFNKRSENLFFKSLPGTAGVAGQVALEDSQGKKIDPAQAQPTDGYKISEVEDSQISFYGFTNIEGGWYVLKIDTDTGSFRYSKGDTNFPEGWNNREKLKYGYFSDVF